MISKLSAGLKKFAVISFVLMGFMLSGHRSVCAGAPNNQMPNKGKQVPKALIAEQSQTPTSTPPTNSRTSDSRESESRTQETEAPAATEKKPLKDFQPSEKIEADQAVDFPYDI
jgi:hypothetical protein